jgi:hypothetical protein
MTEVEHLQVEGNEHLIPAGCKPWSYPGFTLYSGYNTQIANLAEGDAVYVDAVKKINSPYLVLCPFSSYCGRWIDQSDNLAGSVHYTGPEKLRGEVVSQFWNARWGD